MTTTRNAILVTAAVAVMGILAGAFIGHSQEGYVGTKTCATCHPQENKLYETHAHATSPGTIQDEAGIGCEACHGAGEAHVALGPRKLQELAEEDDGDLKIIASTSSDVCGACHSSNDDNMIKLSGDGMILGMQTYNELKRSRKDQFNIYCTACHNPHETSVEQAGISRKCTDCHTGKYAIEINIRAMRGLDCEDCHMPYVVSDTGGVKNGEYVKGQHRSHIFGITVEGDYKFVGSSNQAAIEDDLARLTVEMTCYACHKTGEAKDISREDLLKNAAKIH